MHPILPARTALLFLGDLFVFAAALWLSLFFRALEIPTQETLLIHAVPFGVLFAFWTLLFVIAGLYEKRLLIRRRTLVSMLAVAQGANVIFAALFFFFIPAFGITPKTVLVIYLLVSVVLIVLWRIFIFPYLFGRAKEKVLIIGEGEELESLADELTRMRTFEVDFVKMEGVQSSADLVARIDLHIAQSSPQVILFDANKPFIEKALPALYKHLFGGIRFMTAVDAYEDVFGRIPLSLMSDQWVMRNVSRYVHRFYDVLKRLFDISVGSIGFLVSLVFYPFVAIAIKLETSGPVLIRQPRVGKDNEIIYLYKFRSMERNDTALSKEKSENKVTKVGQFLRKSRIDELPQLFNVVRGDLSLIGPRPELPAGVALYDAEIPLYSLRHLIKPGLSGWAQLYHDAHPHHTADIEATRAKLSYDLYYLKHRSFVLDLVIVLKTIRKVMLHSGT